MKQCLKTILQVINTILLVICLVQINDLKIELQNMKSNTGNQLSSILTNVNNSYSYIEETLAKEASIVSKAEWEFGNIDIKDRTVELKAYVIPKEYQPDVTQAFFLCGDEEIDVAAKYKEDFEIEKAEIIRYIDGKEAERMDITSDAMAAHNTFSYNWNPTYEIPYGSKQEIFVEVTMRCGLVYRSQISSCGMDEQGRQM